MRWTVLVLALVGLSATGCGGDESPNQANIDDPYGLSTVVMPASEPDVLAVLGAMPAEISGTAQTVGDDYALSVHYGDLNSIVAIPLSEGGSSAENLAEDLSRFEAEEGAVVEASQLDPAAELVWLTGSFPDQGGAGVVYLAVWGEPDGPWAFNVSAETPDMRDAMVRSFADAVRAGT